MSGRVPRLGVLVFLYLLCLGLRLPGICSQPAQTDELLWLKRSATLLEKIPEQWTSATSHLGHPGIPATLVMAAGQFAQRSLPAFLKDRFPQECQDKLSASRISLALLSSLVAPVLYVFLLPLVGVAGAFLAALLISFDVRLISLSQIAHLDALLVLLVLLCVFCYRKALLLGDHLLWKILAGVFWGLCIATKPTTIVLLPAFFSYRAYLRLFPEREAKRRPSFVSWSDFGALVVAHITFALLYTRFWEHLSAYRQRLGVRAYLAGWFWRRGQDLQAEPTLAVFLILIQNVRERFFLI